MKFKTLILLSLILSNMLLATPATNERVTSILTAALDARASAANVQPEVQSLKMSRDYFNRVQSNLKELASLSAIEDVRNSSGKRIEDIKESAMTIIAMIPLYEQLVLDFDQMFSLIDQEGMHAPQVKEIWEKIGAYYCGMSSPVPDNKGIETIMTLLKQLDE
jgi:hypothetical protein